MGFRDVRVLIRGLVSDLLKERIISVMKVDISDFDNCLTFYGTAPVSMTTGIYQGTLLSPSLSVYDPNLDVISGHIYWS